MEMYYFRPSNEQRKALFTARKSMGLTQVTLAKAVKVQPFIITNMEILSLDNELGRGVLLHKANQVYRFLGLPEVGEDNPLVKYVGKFNYPKKESGPRRVVRFEYRCRRCKCDFELGRYIPEDQAVNQFKKMIEDYENIKTDCIHACADGGRGYGDVIGLSPVTIWNPDQINV